MWFEKQGFIQFFHVFIKFVIKSLDHGEIALWTHASFAANLSSSIDQKNRFQRKVTWLKWGAPIGPAVGKQGSIQFFLCFIKFVIKSLDPSEIAMWMHASFAANLSSSIDQRTGFRRRSHDSKRLLPLVHLRVKIAKAEAVVLAAVSNI